ncbi:hypothetical protein [Haladaptatus paucihalophilus]|uniref:hypothetical protein n=1 Tax=Haladaptatus paucihalophilus TaxID=367189 RepID=UPI000933A3D7|nr:hypothetical protein [Haladaptatus paucihalophilus]
MADNKKSRDKQARDEENRQRAWEVEQARERMDETEPRDEQNEADEARDEREENSDSFRKCHRRGCDDPAKFVVLERYQEETGHGSVEAEANLCRRHTTEESPTNLDGVYADYVFRVDPLPETIDTDRA